MIMKEDGLSEKKSEDKDLKREQMLRQLKLVEKLATRLPWIVLAISLLAFLAIFLEILLTKSFSF